MTASATIGALRIELGMDAATFDAGVKKAEAAMDRLGASMAKAGDFLRSHAAAIGTAFGVMGVAMGMGIKSAVDRADELDELAQKLGITVEALSGLEYASKLSGVPLETLSQGVTKLSLALQGIAQGDTLSAAARGLSAMGISAQAADGQLVATDELLLQISDKFAGMRDGAEKTALAMNLFGKSGAQLIPFLNAGRDGIEEMRKEADEFGLSLTADAAAGAGLLNEQLDKSVAIFQGFSQHLAQKMTPALIEMTGSFISLQKEMKLTQTLAEGVAFFFKGIVAAGMMISTTFNAIANDIWTLLRAAGNLATFDFSGASAAMKEGFAATRAEIEATHGAITRMFHEAYGPPPPPAGGIAGGGEPPAVTSARAIAEAKRLENEALAEGKRIIEETQTPLEALIAKEHELTKLFAQGAINADVYGRAMQKASLVATNAYAGMAGSIVSDLGKVFENNKAVAIAAALINTYQSVTNAWANVPWPLNIAAAAAALAAGMAQVQNIRSTTKNGGGGGGGASAGGSGGGETGGGAGTAPQLFQIQLQGSNYSRDQVRGLIEQINGAIADGAVLKVMP